MEHGGGIARLSLFSRRMMMEGQHAQVIDRAARRAEVRRVIAMAFPMVVTTSSRALMDIADYVMVTWLGEPAAQAALLPGQIVMWSFIIIGLGVVSMVNTFAAQCLGRGALRDCSAYAWQGLYLALFFGFVGELLRPLIPPLIASFGHEPQVQHLELAYSRVALLTVAPTIAAYGLGWFFVGVHRPWVTMWSAVEANVVNAAVSYGLMFGAFGLPSLGIAGAAWGTLAAVSYRSLRLLATLVGPQAARQFRSRETWRPSAGRMVDLFRVGLPFSFQWVGEVAVWTVFVNVLVGSRFGTEHLIATNIAWQYMRIAFLPTMGLGQALTSLVGKAIGAGEADRAMRETRIAAMVTLAYMGSLSLVYLLVGAELIALFNADAAVVRVGRAVMLCAACFQLFDALAITYGAALRGAGDTFVPSIVLVGSAWVMVIGGGWFMASLYPALGSVGPWLAASGLIVFTGVFLWWRWRSRAWMQIDLFGRWARHAGAGHEQPGIEAVLGAVSAAGWESGIRSTDDPSGGDWER